VVTLQCCARQIAVQRFECDEQTNGQTYNVIPRKTERTHGAVANRVQYVRVLRNGRWLTTSFATVCESAEPARELLLAGSGRKSAALQSRLQH